jgi:hypothetical protein
MKNELTQAAVVLAFCATLIPSLFAQDNYIADFDSSRLLGFCAFRKTTT